MSESEKLIIKMLCRLFWLVTQTPGVARYYSDIKFFGEAEIALGNDDGDSIRRVIDSYKKE